MISRMRSPTWMEFFMSGLMQSGSTLWGQWGQTSNTVTIMGVCWDSPNRCVRLHWNPPSCTGTCWHSLHKATQPHRVMHGTTVHSGTRGNASMARDTPAQPPQTLLQLRTRRHGPQATPGQRGQPSPTPLPPTPKGVPGMDPRGMGCPSPGEGMVAEGTGTHSRTRTVRGCSVPQPWSMETEKPRLPSEQAGMETRVTV